MINNLPELLNNFNNPYIALAESIIDKEKEQNSSLFSLLTFLKNTTKENINEEMFLFKKYDYNYNYHSPNNDVKLLSNNLIEVLANLSFSNSYSWNNKKPNELFDLLESLNFDFTKETKIWEIPTDKREEFIDVKNKYEFLDKTKELKLNYYLNDTIFNNVSMHEERTICLLGHAFKQMDKSLFEERVIKYETLIQAVKQNKINVIKFLIENCGVNPNITNKNLTTPIMECNSLETLKILNNYDINWFSKDIFGKDCITNFTNLSDKEKSKDMINLAQKRISESVNSNSVAVDSNYVENRIKQNLLEMVEADKTKKELEDFIKKYKIKNFSDIFDKDGNSLAQICLKKNNWARFNIFKNSYDFAHVNNNGEGYLETLFVIDRVSYEEQAKKVFEEILDNNIQKKNTNFSFNVIKNDFENERAISIRY